MHQKLTHKRCKPVIAAFLSITGLIASSSILAEELAPDLLGAWSGLHSGGAYFGSPGHSPDKAEPTVLKPGMEFTLDITKQEGRSLIGTWSSANKSEKIVGAIRVDNKTIVLADEDTQFSGVLLDTGRMELCATEAGEVSSLASCLILERR